ncbi:MAG: DUF4445 domain-containing protein [Thermoguttaceae bacterium]|nr:DUF4445 domain-containing protein [Thermoguttaceae bacterium]
MDAKTIPVPQGALVADVLREKGFELDFDCGGAGICGKCRVSLIESDGSRRDVLACRARGARGTRVDASNLKRTPSKICVPEETLEPVDVAEPERRGDLALAVDLGSTTIVVALVSLESGRTLVVLSDRNPQVEFGRDVVSRIAAASDPAKALRARALASGAIERLALKAAGALGLAPSRIVEIVVAGNTTMEYLLAGRDVRPLGVAPFVVEQKTFEPSSGRDFDWSAFPEARVRLFPVRSAFIGGDVLAGLELPRGLGAFERDESFMLLDFGTNGELLLSARGRLFASSSAAGPAFEGAGISQGSTAILGAIRRVDYDVPTRRWRARTIGDAPSASVCGSGLIDALAAALDFGLLEPSGRFARADASRPSDGVFERIGEREGEPALLISSDARHPVWLTRRDVRQTQLALGAMKACARLTLQASGLDAESLDALYLSGGFGTSLSARNGRRVGATPEGVGVEKIVRAGNSSLLGAIEATLGKVDFEELTETSERIELVDLASRADFAEVFAESTRFPEKSPE